MLLGLLPTRPLLLLAPACLVIGSAGLAQAQVSAGGLGTRVNGTALGRCTGGICTVQGGTKAGPNQFYRFSQFDTRTKIKRVDLDTRGRRHVVVGVGAPNGSFFGAPVHLSEAANLFWLSPGGIWLGNGAGFSGATNLLLSTSPTMRFGGKEFDVLAATASEALRLDQGPNLDLERLTEGGGTDKALGVGVGPIVLAGGRLRVDRNLLIDSGVGPVRSEPATGQRGIEAGSSVQLSGGAISLQGLDVTASGMVEMTAGDAGGRATAQLAEVRLAAGDVLLSSGGPLTATDLRAETKGGSGRLELRSGAGPAGETSLRLNRAEIEGSAVLITSEGPGDLRQMRVRAGGADGSGVVLMRIGSPGGEATTTRLEAVTVSGGDVLLRSTGALAASNLRVAAGEAGGRGRLQLETGAASTGNPSLRLDQPDLQGRQVVVLTTGASELRQGQVRVPLTAASQGGEADVFLRARPGSTGSTSPLTLEQMGLSGPQVVVEAAGDLLGRDLQVQADQIWLKTERYLDAGSLRLEGASRLSAQRLNAQAGLDLSGEGLSVQSESLVSLKAGRTLRLANSELRADSTQGQILLDALATAGADRNGAMELRSTRLEGATLTARADESLKLENVAARAGTPGNRGRIRLMTAPTLVDTPDKPDPDAGSRGKAQLEGGRLEAGTVTLRSGTIELDGIAITAPKGKIHLEAKAGNLSLRASRLDVGVSRREDLRTEVDLWGIRAIDDSVPNTPSIGLFSTGNLNVVDFSLLRASQDLAQLRQAHPALARSEIRLTDTSGVVVADAGQALSLRDSAIEADASDNLAGNILLRSRASAAEGGLELRNASLSASGGVGSGDIRLNSAGGIRITDSTLVARSSHSPEDPDNPGQASWQAIVNGLGIGAFQGGEITLTNSSEAQGVSITNTQLRAEQSGSEGVLSMYNLAGKSDPTEWADAFDDSDNQTSNLYGGLISILSSGGIAISGKNTLLSTSSVANKTSDPEVFGGMIRLVNTADTTPLEISGGARLESITGPGSNDDSGKPATGGMVNTWSAGPILFNNVTVDTHTEVADGDPLSPYFQGGIALYSQQQITLQESNLRLGTSSGGGEGLGELALFTPLEPVLLNATIAPACGGSCLWNWDEDRFRSFLGVDERPFIWGPYRQPNYGLAPEYNDSSFRIKDEYFTGNPQGRVPIPSIVNAWPDKIPVRRIFVPGQPPISSDDRPVPPRGTGRSNPVAPVAPPAPPQPSLLAMTSEAAAQLSTVPPIGTIGREVLAPLPLLSPEAPLSEGTSAMSQNAVADNFLRNEQNASQDVSAALGLRSRPGPRLAIGNLQRILRQSLAFAGQRAQPRMAAATYMPAIVQISLSTPVGTGQTQINHILIPARGEIQGWQTQVATIDLQTSLRGFQRQLSQQESPDDGEAGRRLAALLVNPLWPTVKALGINAVLLSLDRGLQGIPFAALPVAEGLVVDHMAITITPALGLTELEPGIGPPQRRRTVLAGASRFSNGLSPLTMAEQELRRLASLHSDSLLLLNEAFQTRTLLERTRERPVDILHLATHADFASLRADGARIYTRDGTLSLAELGQQLRRGQSEPLSLFVLNACRTAVGNEEKELGIAGLALQAGASSALGNLWFVDDVVTAAFSVQFHLALQRGMGKDLALQQTQDDFRSGRVRVRGTEIINDTGEPLITGLHPSDQQRLSSLTHPYFWAGAVLTGRPW